jgi:integrase
VAARFVILSGMARRKGQGTVYWNSKRREYVGQFFVQTQQGSKRRTVYAKTEPDCWAKMAEARQWAADDIWEAENPYLADWLDTWLGQIKNRVRVRTFERYEQNVRVHIKSALGQIRVKDLRRQQIQDLYDDKATALSPRTVNYIHVTLHAALDAAVQAGKAQRNVSDLAHPPKQRRPKPRFWAAEEAMAFLDAARNDRFYPLYILAATTGMRQGELLGLHWPEVALDRRRIAVVQSLVWPKKSPPVLEELKTWESRRSVGLVDRAVEALAGLDCSSGLVFRSQRNTFLNPSNIVNRSFKPLVARVGLPPIAFKDLRHTAASLLLKLGIHPKQVQEMLGHKDIRLTLNTYSHISPDMQDSVITAMDLALDRSQKPQSFRPRPPK